MDKVEKYEYAYAEVLEVLNYLSMDDYRKIPKKYIIFMEENCDENCDFVYNLALPLERQEISETAKDILGMIFRLFILSDEKREELDRKDRLIQHNEELEKKIQYNPDELFKKESFEDKKIINDNVNLSKTKESFIERLIKRIKRVFNN